MTILINMECGFNLVRAATRFQPRSFKFMGKQQPMKKNSNKTLQICVALICQSAANSHKRCRVFVPV